MKKKEIAEILDSMDLPDIAYKMNAYYRKPESVKFLPMRSQVEPYVSAGICQQHIWEKMAEIILQEVKKALKIKPLRRAER